MDKYEVLGLLGEGCFGRVYKAKQISNSAKVALKVISKRGRSIKEIKALRRECEIQRYLHHPNIIQMLDSFETENEIVVITEFAHKELTAILSKEVYLSEEKVQIIVWDLVSALYYLHSHRVLHRDLKPQNILLDSKNNIKLCDFGFARNMSTGTHVLTSIKGTPLYMAPELIEEHPYDHTADLWSLGCIVYELLVGTPPFCTTSILQLIRKIRYEDIELPTFISSSCTSFLKGLLQKDAKKRLGWPEILKHPFVKGHILILEDIPSKPLTRPLSYDTLQAKEQQRMHCLTQKAHTNNKLSLKSSELTESTIKKSAKCSSSKTNRTCTISNRLSDEVKKKSHNLDEKNGNIVASVESNDDAGQKMSSELHKSTEYRHDDQDQSLDNKITETVNCSMSLKLTEGSICSIPAKDNLNFDEDTSPIENEEWIVFLKRNIDEVMTGEMTSLCQSSVANIAISPLRNSNTSSKVVGYVASLFALPFVVPGTPEDVMKQIKKVYIDIKLIPNLIYASKLLLKHHNLLTASPQCSFTRLSLYDEAEEDYGSVADMTEDDFHALERLYQLICHLVYLDVQFLQQFCDSVMVLNMPSIIKKLLISKQRFRIVADVIAILTHILRIFPENLELTDKVISSPHNENELEENEVLNFTQLLRHSNSLIRERSCHFLKFLAKSSSKHMEDIWSSIMRSTLEALVYDSMENVRNAAEAAVDELRKTTFYHKKMSSTTELCVNENSN